MATIADLIAKLGMDNSKYMKGVSQAEAAADKMASRIEKATDGIDVSKGVTKSAADLEGAATSASGVLSGVLGGAMTKVSGIAGTLGPVLATIGVAAQKAFSIAVSAAKIFLDILKKVAKAAAVAGGAMAALAIAGLEVGRRWARSAAEGQLVEAAFQGITQQAGLMGDEILAAMDKAAGGTIGMVQLMKSFNQAMFLAGEQMAVSLVDALPLLQKVAVATGESFEFMLSSMVRGVSRLSPRILDNLGVVVKLETAYQRWADANDRTVESMTQADKQAALLAESMRQLEKNTQGIPDVADTALGAFLRLRTNLDSLKRQIGTDLIPTFGDLARGINNIFPAIRAFGRLFSGTLAALVDAGQAFIRGFAAALGADLGSIADDAGAWGSNIVMSLASGMAAAAGAVIQVLNDIAAAIANWLAPGSPPKLLPDLPEWGESAMMEFLKGMTESNLGILRDLSGRISRFFRSTMGDATSQEIARAILDARARLEQVLGTGADIGTVLEGLPGPLRDYAQALFQVEQATKAVEQAQNHLNDVQTRYADLLRPVNSQLDAISDRQRQIRNQQERTRLEAIISDENAPEAAKEMARLELRRMALEENKDALEDERDTAVTAAQARLQAAHAAQEAAEAQLDAQEQMMEHQVEFNELLQQTVDAIEDVAKASAGGGGGGGGGMELPEIDEVGGAGGLAGSLEESMSELAGRIRGEFDPVVAAFEELGKNVGRIVGENESGGIRGIIRDFRIGLGQDVDASDRHLMNLGASFGEPASAAERAGELVSQGWDKVRAWFDNNQPAIKTMLGDIGRVMLGMAGVAILVVSKIVEWWPKIHNAMETVRERVETNFALLKKGARVLKDRIVEAVSNLKDRAIENFNRFKQGLRELAGRIAGWVLTQVGKFNELKDNIVERFNTIRETIGTKIEEAKEAFKTAVDKIKTKANDIFGPGGTVQTAVENIRNKFQSIFGAGGSIATAISTGIEWIDNLKQAAVDKIEGTLTSVLNTFNDNVLSPLSSGFNAVKSAIERVVNWIGNLIEKVQNVDLGALTAFIRESPVPFAEGMKVSQKQLARFVRTLPLLAREMDKIGDPSLAPEIPRGARAAMNGAQAGAQAGGQQGDERTILGKLADVIEINNDMDLNMFEARLLQILESAK